MDESYPFNHVHRTLNIGVYSGHESSTAVVYDRATDKIYQVSNKFPINIHANKYPEIINSLTNVFHKVAALNGWRGMEDLLRSCERMVVALPGVGLPADQEESRNIVVHATDWPSAERDSLDIVDDTWAALYADTVEPFGICALAQTGASVCWATGEFVADKAHKIDGWGPLLGDDGSAFDLATRFIRKICRITDREAIPPPLLDEVRGEMSNDPFMKKWPQIEQAEYLHRWFASLRENHPQDWLCQLARLASPICHAADREHCPDKLARSLVRKCGKKMAQSIQLAINRAVTDRPLPVILQGGLFEISSCYRTTVTEALGLPESLVRLANCPPEVGALLLSFRSEREMAMHVQAKFRSSYATSLPS